MRWLPRMTEVVPLCTPDGKYLADARVPIGRGPRPELLRWQGRHFRRNDHGFYIEQTPTGSWSRPERMLQALA